MDDEPDETCPACDGARTVSVDMFTPSRDHYTVEEPCERCVSDDPDDSEREEDLSPLERGAPYLAIRSVTRTS